MGRFNPIQFNRYPIHPFSHKWSLQDEKKTRENYENGQRPNPLAKMASSCLIGTGHQHSYAFFFLKWTRVPTPLHSRFVSYVLSLSIPALDLSAFLSLVTAVFLFSLSQDSFIYLLHYPNPPLKDLQLQRFNMDRWKNDLKSTPAT
ncbi:hypothetical protein Hanom_Chr07g00603891 [Helianthus anomalus]